MDKIIKGYFKWHNLMMMTVMLLSYSLLLEFKIIPGIDVTCARIAVPSLHDSSHHLHK